MVVISHKDEKNDLNEFLFNLVKFFKERMKESFKCGLLHLLIYNKNKRKGKSIQAGSVLTESNAAGTFFALALGLNLCQDYSISHRSYVYII